MERRRLGRLGHDSSVLIYGAAALAEVTRTWPTRRCRRRSTPASTTSTSPRATATRSCGSARGCRASATQIFLATKTGERDARAAPGRQINASLERLQTDHVDLLQLHAVGDLDELDKVTGPGGALEAALRAQDEGLVGAVGITGHGDEAPPPTSRRCAGTRSRPC